MKTIKFYSIGLVVIMIFTFSQHTFTQDYSFYNQMYSNMLSNRIWDSIYQQSSPGYTAAKKKLSKSNSKPSKQISTTPVTPGQMNSAVQFKPSGTRLTTQKFADGLGDKLKLDKAEMKEMLTVILDTYDAEAAAKGLPNDLALALVSFVAYNRYVYSEAKEKSMPPFAQIRELRNMIVEYTAQNGSFDKMTNPQKQEMYESLVMLGVFTHLIYEEAKKTNDVQSLKLIKQMAKQNLNSVGINP